MDRKQKIWILKNIACRALIFFGCLGFAYLIASIAGQLDVSALGAMYYLGVTALTTFFVGFCVALGNTRPFWFYAILGFAITIIPVLFLRDLQMLGILYPLAVGCINAVFCGGLHHYLTKLVDRLILGPTAK